MGRSFRRPPGPRHFASSRGPQCDDGKLVGEAGRPSSLAAPGVRQADEALLTDLLWRSRGIEPAVETAPGTSRTLRAFDRRKGLHDLRRLVARKAHGGSPKALETYPIALEHVIERA